MDFEIRYAKQRLSEIRLEAQRWEERLAALLREKGQESAATSADPNSPAGDINDLEEGREEAQPTKLAIRVAAPLDISPTMRLEVIERDFKEYFGDATSGNGTFETWLNAAVCYFSYEQLKFETGVIPQLSAYQIDPRTDRGYSISLISYAAASAMLASMGHCVSEEEHISIQSKWDSFVEQWQKVLVDIAKLQRSFVICYHSVCEDLVEVFPTETRELDGQLSLPENLSSDTSPPQTCVVTSAWSAVQRISFSKKTLSSSAQRAASALTKKWNDARERMCSLFQELKNQSGEIMASIIVFNLPKLRLLQARHLKAPDGYGDLHGQELLLLVGPTGAGYACLSRCFALSCMYICIYVYMYIFYYYDDDLLFYFH